jgi:hypothetical protein
VDSGDTLSYSATFTSANGDVDMSGSFAEDYVVASDLV